MSATENTNENEEHRELSNSSEGENSKASDMSKNKNIDDSCDGNAGMDEVEALKAKNAELQEGTIRIAAEMENLRKRLEREKNDAIKYATEKLLGDLVSVLDSFDKAVPESGENSEKSDTGKNMQDGGSSGEIFKGMQLVKRQLLETLAKHGLEVVKTQGHSFDPNVHQAIQKIESDECDSEVIGTEFAKGYLLRGRLIRPAMVSVLVPNEGSGNSES